MRCPRICLWIIGTKSRALDSVGGDEEFLSELADVFSFAGPRLLKNLEDSGAAKNAFSLADTAQLLRRAAGDLGATRVAEAALVVETMARRSDLDDIGSACRVLRQEAQRLLDRLADFKKAQSELRRTRRQRRSWPKMYTLWIPLRFACNRCIYTVDTTQS